MGSEPDFRRVTASYVVGVGMSTAATAGEVREAVAEALERAGIPRSAVQSVATRRSLADDSRVVALGLPVVFFDDERLAAVAVVNPSERVAAAVSTASVAEAAALLAAGGSAVLVLPKQRRSRVTVAIARGS